MLREPQRQCAARGGTDEHHALAYFAPDGQCLGGILQPLVPLNFAHRPRIASVTREARVKDVGAESRTEFVAQRRHFLTGGAEAMQVDDRERCLTPIRMRPDNRFFGAGDNVRCYKFCIKYPPRPGESIHI